MVTSDIVVCGVGVTESGTGPLGPFLLVSGSALSQLVADAPGQPATRQNRHHHRGYCGHRGTPRPLDTRHSSS
jgi:uncharacterized protein RhaS with RHS repeats